MSKLKYLIFAAVLAGSSGIAPLTHAQTPDPHVSQACQETIPTVPSNASNTPTIRIVAPIADAIFYGNSVAVTVETEHFALDVDGQHWHLWVDGALQTMAYNHLAVVDLPPGKHQLCAVLGDGRHVDIGVPTGIEITVIEPASGTPRSTLTILSAPTSLPSSTVSETENGTSVVYLMGVIGIALLVGGVSIWVGSRSRASEG